MINITDDGLDLLRTAIVEQAAKDYQKVLKKKKRNPKYESYSKKELEDFFESQWFEWLVNCDGEYIMNEIKRMVRNEKGR